MKTYIIYKLIFPNGKYYIGQTSNFKHRMETYKYKSRDIRLTSHIYNAIRKYDWKGVQTEIIMSNVHPNLIDMFEKLYIGLYKHLKISYNLDNGGNKNKIRSELTKRKLSINHPHKRKIMQVNASGQLLKEWYCIKEASRKLNIGHGEISRACSGLCHSSGGFIWFYKEDFNEKNLNNKLLKLKKNKPILQIDKRTGKIIKEWKRAIDIQLSLKIPNGNISSVCLGKRKTAGGFIFKYKNSRRINKS